MLNFTSCCYSRSQVVEQEGFSSISGDAQSTSSYFAADANDLDLPEELRDIAFREFQETPELRREKLLELRKMILELPQEQRILDLSDKNLIKYLRGRQYNLEKALQITIRSRKFETKYPELIENSSGEEFLQFGNAFQILKKRDKEGRVIGFIRPGVIAKVICALKTPAILPRLMCWIFKNLSEDPYVQVCGLVMINSFSNLSYIDGITVHTTVPMDQRITAVKYLQDCTAIRLKGVYVFDQPAFVAVVYNVIYYALSFKVRERVHICSQNYGILAEKVHPDMTIFPRCVGGGQDDDGDGDNWIARQHAKEVATN